MTATGVARSVTFVPPDADAIARIVINRPDDRVNAIDTGLVEDLAEAVRVTRASEGVRGLIVASAKANQFVAGADLKMVPRAGDGQALEAAARRLQAVLDELAWLSCTTVAAIDGAALGGGLELALACDYRVASQSPSVILGQPEVNLGLIPAGGGTQRLPRLVGLQRALDLILNGRRLSAGRARRAGLLDEVVHPAVLDLAARTWAAKPKRSLDRPLTIALNAQAAMDLAEQTPISRRLVYRQARQAVLERTRGHYPAPLKALEAVRIGFERGMAAGLEAEARAFGELATTDTARNLIWLFMATQRQKRQDSLADAAAVTRMGVVGAGFMGAAIAEVGAAAGITVRVRDVDPEAVARGLANIRQMVDEGVARRRFDAREAHAILQRVSGATDYSGFGKADLVIEAVFEDLTVKRNVVRELEAVLPPEAVIASNTSAIPISAVAAEAAHPERVVGMHFFSPAHRMPLLEVVRPTAAADQAVARAVAAGNKLGKSVIVVGDSPGFFTSRVLGVMMNEAVLVLNDGASMAEVDRAMTAFGFPVGPFVLYDEVGLEVAQHAGETVARAFGDRIPPARLVADLVARGDTGRKAGRGFYLWPLRSRLSRAIQRFTPAPRRTPNPAVLDLVTASTRRGPELKEIQDRLVLLFVNEAVRCLEGGVLQSPTDGDLGAVLGLGFPPFRGGPFHYADAIGLETLADTLRRLADRHGPRYEPASSLVERACVGRTFYAEG